MHAGKLSASHLEAAWYGRFLTSVAPPTTPASTVAWNVNVLVPSALITTELVLADLEAVAKRIEKTQKKAKSGDAKTGEEAEAISAF